jgi:predicted O-methyltransferase YrrM
MNPFLSLYPVGHYYSPIPNEDAIRDQYEHYRRLSEFACVGVDLRQSEQLELLRVLSGYIDQCPFPDTQTALFRYYFENEMYHHQDGSTLYAVLRHFKPRRILEVGAGWSTALMLDTIDRDPELNPTVVTVSPSMWQLQQLMPVPHPQLTMEECQIETVPWARFAELQAGDLLFIDSSHMVKFGSEVPYLISGVLPRLAAGVIVHFHDMFWPFEYPHAWLKRGMGFNEAYLLRAFLQYNPAFRVLLFNDWLRQTHPGRLHPLSRKSHGSSLWLVKTGEPL